MPLTALVAVVLAVVLVTGAGLLVAADRRRARAVVAGLVGADGGGSLDELAATVATALEAARRQGADASAMLARLAEALSAVPEGVVVCDERGAVRHRNEVAQQFADGRHGEALADLAVTELLEAAL